jgi:hypothetical protein
MKYYVYISDAKVDMLLPQISETHKKKVATEYGIDLKVFSAKRKVEQEENENRIARLEAVVSFIREFGNLGTVQKPDEYLEDSMPMYFRLLGRDADAIDAVFFFGKELDSYVGMGGSARHLIGSSGARESWLASSLTPILLRVLRESLEPNDKATIESDWNLWLATECFEESEKRGLPLENYRFMAKRLAVADYTTGQKVILSTPLYVAKDD